MLHLSDINAVVVKQAPADGYTKNGLHAFGKGVADLVIPEVNGCLLHHMIPLVFISLPNCRPQGPSCFLLMFPLFSEKMKLR